MRFVWRGELFTVPLPGVFNIYNCLAALSLGDALGLDAQEMKRSLEHIAGIDGRAERVERGQPFAVVVDYAHTPDSLKALYEAYAVGSPEGKRRRIIGVLGATGGGRDAWKRSAMGRIADEYCSSVYLTNEDPYDEDPQKIVDDVAQGFVRITPSVVLDRRAALAAALQEAHKGDVVLISGKGTDPYIMGKGGSKQEWSDVQVATEELSKLGYN